MADPAAVIVPVAVAVAAPGITYLVMRRKSSGKVNTSEAGELWKANQEFQAALTVEMEKLRERSRICEARNEELQARVLKLESEAHGAAIIAAARVEAEAIRAAAKLAEEKVKQEAVVVKKALDREKGEHD